MTDWDDRRSKGHRDPTEGVRLLGADEAAEALERDDIRRRFDDDRPRFGDRPAGPPEKGPRPALRFPLGSFDDPNSIERPPVVPVERRAPEPELSHWSGSAAEEVPNMTRRDPGRGDDTWSGYDRDPRWRDDAPPQHAQSSPPRQPGNWPDPAPQPGGGRAPLQGTPVAFEEGAEPPAGRSVFDAPAGPPAAGPLAGPPAGGDAYAEDTYADDYEAGYDDAYDDVYDDEVYEDPAAGFAPPVAGHAPRGRAPGRTSRRAPDRDMRTAVVVGVAFLAAALGLFAVLGTRGGMIVVVPILGYAAYEYFVAVNTAGFEAPMAVGVAAAVGLPIAAYNYGEAAIPLVLVLAVAVAFLWYLVNAGGERPVANIGVTLLGIGWIGLFGSFAALLLGDPNGNGVRCCSPR